MVSLIIKKEKIAFWKNIYGTIGILDEIMTEGNVWIYFVYCSSAYWMYTYGSVIKNHSSLRGTIRSLYGRGKQILFKSLKSMLHIMLLVMLTVTQHYTLCYQMFFILSCWNLEKVHSDVFWYYQGFKLWRILFQIWPLIPPLLINFIYSTVQLMVHIVKIITKKENLVSTVLQLL